MKAPRTATVAKGVIGVVGYSVWAYMAYLDPAQRSDFLKFNIFMAMGTIGLILRDMQHPPQHPPTTTTKEELP